jgi:hypothetical protein
VCYQATPYRLDQGADLGRHVEDLDKYMTIDYLQAIEDVQIITDNLTRRSVSKSRTGEGRPGATRCDNLRTPSSNQLISWSSLKLGSYRGRSHVIIHVLLAPTTQILVVAQARIIQGKVTYDNPCTPSSNNSDPGHRSSLDRTGEGRV